MVPSKGLLTPFDNQSLDQLVIFSRSWQGLGRPLYLFDTYSREEESSLFRDQEVNEPNQGTTTIAQERCDFFDDIQQGPET